MISNFCLLSGNDIPFLSAKVVIHQPTLKEIALIGEEVFFLGCGLLNFSKDLLNEKDKVRLENITDFNILLTLFANEKNNKDGQENIFAGISVLKLLFPDYQINFTKTNISLEKNGVIGSINEENFIEFKEILAQIFGLRVVSGNDCNPVGPLAKRIAEKIKKGHQQLAKLKGSQKQDIFGRYASVLSIGCGIDINKIFHYTVYQLYDSIQRLNLKQQYDSYFRAKLAGAKDLGEIQDWEIDLEDISKEKNK